MLRKIIYYIRNNAAKENSIIIIFIIIFTILSLSVNHFFSVINILNILRQASITGVIAVGMTFIILTGGIDLSVGAVLALSACIGADIIHNGYIVLGIFAILAISMFCGFLNGFLIVMGKLPDFIVTLAMMSIARGCTLVYTKGLPISRLPEKYYVIGQGTFLKIPIPVFILIVAFLIASFVLNKTVYGRYIYGVGGNILAAKASGINVGLVKILVYVIGGFCVGLGAIIFTSRLAGADPTAGSGYELNVIAGVVIGGTSLFGGEGRISGTFIGIILMAVISNAMNLIGISVYWQQVVIGSILIIAVLIAKVGSGRE